MLISEKPRWTAIVVVYIMPPIKTIALARVPLTLWYVLGRFHEKEELLCSVRR